MSELQFLTLIFADETQSSQEHYHLVYAGAADGRHICHLRDYFPRVTFILIDPERFALTCPKEDIINITQNQKASALTDSSKVYIINDLFTNQLAKELSTLSNLLFVSDIRTTAEGESPTDTDILWNSAQQYNWVTILKPSASMLKFRLPWYSGLESSLHEILTQDLELAKKNGIDFIADYNNKVLRHFKGTIYLQAFAPISSTETRLVILGDDHHKLQEYKPEHYDDPPCSTIIILNEAMSFTIILIPIKKSVLIIVMTVP